MISLITVSKHIPHDTMQSTDGINKIIPILSYFKYSNFCNLAKSSLLTAVRNIQHRRVTELHGCFHFRRIFFEEGETLLMALLLFFFLLPSKIFRSVGGKKCFRKCMCTTVALL